jgi:hypothetical protein
MAACSDWLVMLSGVPFTMFVIQGLPAACARWKGRMTPSGVYNSLHYDRARAITQCDTLVRYLPVTISGKLPVMARAAQAAPAVVLDDNIAVAE